jgi:uncharacterized membrane protein YkoI
MKRIVIACSLLFILIMTGCYNFSRPEISEDEAKSIVLKEHTKHIGKVKVISLIHKGNKYVVQWENEENCENGTDYVHDQTGEITKGEVSIC